MFVWIRGLVVLGLVRGLIGVAMPIGFTVGASDPAVAQDRCPAHSHQVFKSDNTLYCKCDTPFVNYGGGCMLRATAKDRLGERIYWALKGIKYTSEAIEAERSTLMYATFRKHLGKIAVEAGSLYLTKSSVVGAALAKESLNLSNDVGATLGLSNACSATPELRVDCDNLRNFQKILHQSGTELQKIQDEARVNCCGLCSKRSRVVKDVA